MVTENLQTLNHKFDQIVVYWCSYTHVSPKNDMPSLEKMTGFHPRPLRPCKNDFFSLTPCFCACPLLLPILLENHPHHSAVIWYGWNVFCDMYRHLPKVAETCPTRGSLVLGLAQERSLTLGGHLSKRLQDSYQETTALLSRDYYSSAK